MTAPAGASMTTSTPAGSVPSSRPVGRSLCGPPCTRRPYVLHGRVWRPRRRSSIPAGSSAPVTESAALRRRRLVPVLLAVRPAHPTCSQRGAAWRDRSSAHLKPPRLRSRSWWPECRGVGRPQLRVCARSARSPASPRCNRHAGRLFTRVRLGAREPDTRGARWLTSWPKRRWTRAFQAHTDVVATSSA